MTVARVTRRLPVLSCTTSCEPSVPQGKHAPRFLYLMSSTNGLAEGKLKRVRSRIGDASNPFYRIMSQNRLKGYPSGSKLTRAGAPHWRLDLVIGPFTKGATLFRKQWEHQTRELDTRIVRGILQARTQARRSTSEKIYVWARDPTAVKMLLRKHSAIMT